MDVAIVLVLAGLLMVGVLRAEQLIGNARVRSAIAQQASIEEAILAFQDRFRALPGDYHRASEFIECANGPCPNGNGNGRVESVADNGVHEDLLAWHHLSASGILQDRYEMQDGSESVPTPTNSPRNAFGGFIHFGFDDQWGLGATTSPRHNLKTGNYLPSDVLAEIDRKIDDGLPGRGQFQFSRYAGDGALPPAAGAPQGCTSAASAAAAGWVDSDGADNCGAAILLH